MYKVETRLVQAAEVILKKLQITLGLKGRQFAS